MEKETTSATQSILSAVKQQEDLFAQYGTPSGDPIGEADARARAVMRQQAKSARQKAKEERQYAEQELWGDIRPNAQGGILGRLRLDAVRLPSVSVGRPRSLALRSAVLSGSILALIGASSFAFPVVTDQAASAALSVVPLDREETEALESARACATYIQVWDADRTLIGFVPSRTACGDPGDHTASVFAPSLITADMTAEEVAAFSAVIDIVEGPSSGPGVPLGISLPGLARAVQGLVTGDRIGGSSGWVSALEVLRDEQASGLSIRQKLRSIWFAARLAATPNYLAPESRNHLVATVMPAAIEMSGPRRGLAIAGNLLPSLVFEADSISDLSVGQLCILAAGIKRQILLPGPNASAQTANAAELRLEEVRERAISRCLRPLEQSGILSAEAAAEELAAILDFSLPLGRGSLSPPGLPRLLADAEALYPENRRSIDLSVTQAGQTILVESVEELRERVEPHLGSDLCASDCDHGEEQLDILAVAVRTDRPDLPIVAAFQSRHGLWTGPYQDGVRGVVTRAIASVTKALATPILTGLDLVCRERFANLHDGGRAGVDCNVPGALISPEEMLARSSNTGFANALRQVGPETAAEFLSSLGAEVIRQGGQDRLRRDIATGTALQIAPERVVRAFAAIVSGAMGDTPTASGPILRYGDPADTLVLDQVYFDHPERLRELLGAPIHHPAGTLHALEAPLVAMGCRADTLFGKSGTSEGVGPTGHEVRDRLLILSAECDGIPIVIWAMMGSPRIDMALQGVSAADVQSLALATLRAGLDAARAADSAPTTTR